MKATGQVVRMPPASSYGFIRADPEFGRIEDLFFHSGEVRGPVPFNELDKGHRVTFTIAPQPDGRYRAVDVET